MAEDDLTNEIELAAALRTTSTPPQAWIDAAVAIPAMLADLASIDRLVASGAFRDAFAQDPERALTEAGLTPSVPLVSAVRERLAS
jgi:hypothetical protein